MCCTDSDTVTRTLNAKLVHTTISLRDPPSLTEEHDPVNLYAKACAHKHTKYIYIEQTESIENDFTPNRLLPLFTVHPSNDFKVFVQQSIVPSSKVCAINICIYISSDCVCLDLGSARKSTLAFNASLRLLVSAVWIDLCAITAGVSRVVIRRHHPRPLSDGWVFTGLFTTTLSCPVCIR